MGATPRASRPGARAALQSFLAVVQGARERAATGTVEQVIDQLLRETGYQDHLYRTFDDGEDRWNNVQELRTVAANYDALAPSPGDALPDAPGEEAAAPASALATFLADVALVADVDNLEEGPNAVTLITLHAAKGPRVPRRLPDRHGGDTSCRTCAPSTTRRRWRRNDGSATWA